MANVARKAGGEAISSGDIVRKTMTLDRESIDRLRRIAAKSNGVFAPGRSDSAIMRWALALAEAHLDAGLGPADLTPARNRNGAKP